MSNTDIKIGVVAALVGPFAAMGEDGMRGVTQAVREFGGEISGRTITIRKESSNAIPSSAQDAAYTLIEQQNVDFMIGPLSGNEGLAVRDYAKTQPDKVFINGSAGTQDMTLRDPAPNFFNFLTNGAQWMAGLGSYVYNVQGYKRVVTVGEDYSLPHGQVGSFTVEFCRVGGDIIKNFWVPLGTDDFSPVVAAIPANIDAIFVALGGTDAYRFLSQYYTVGGKAPLIGGTLTVDQTVLSTKGEPSERLIGMASSGPIADNDPTQQWHSFVNTYRQLFPMGATSPSLTAYGYYVNTKAALLALQQVDGDLSNGEARFKEALAKLSFESPTGRIELDHNRSAIANIFLTVLAKDERGKLYNKLVKKIPYVTQTLGLPEDEYMALGPFTRNNPDCLKLKRFLRPAATT